jgi:type IX secretion system PorP/SprF family membrane protein
MRVNITCLLLLLFLMLVSPGANAQQRPHYTQYLLNQFIINPAITGIENYTDIKLSHRHQWAGFQDAPVTSYLTIHAPIGKSDYRTTATSYTVPGENPRGKRYWEEYTSAQPHHGVGLQIINDVTGPLSRFGAYATYAYHIGLTPRTSLSGGVGVGMSRLGLNASKLQFATSVDPAVASSGIINDWRPDFMAGVYLYSDDYFVGLSAQQVVPQKIEFAENALRRTRGSAVPHFFVTGGYRFLLGEDFNLIPSVMVKYVNPTPVQFDVNARLLYRDLLWTGIGYRYQDGFSATAGLNVSNVFNVAYSYDYTISPLRTFSKGTHEVQIGFLVGNKYADGCPKNVW